MDTTALAQRLLEPIPAHRTFGICVLQAADGAAEVAIETTPKITNVVDALHSSGLVALVDATGLAAIIASCAAETELDQVLPLGTAASIEFCAPARGRVVASCRLDPDARRAIEAVLSRRETRTRVSTLATVRDEADVIVCRGRFEWSIRRMSERAQS